MLARLKFDLDELANEILDRMDQSLFERDDTTFLDPAMAGGQLLKVVESRLRLHGHSDKNINKRVFGVPENPLHIGFARKKNNLVCQIIKKEELNTDMKFDIIIGNPPFQASHGNGDRKDQASNLWTRFWADTITKSNSNTKIALITPTSWLSPSGDLKGDAKVGGEGRLWNIFNKYSSVANVTDVEKHFAGVGSTFGYVIVDKNGSDGLSFSDGSDTRLGFLPKSGNDFVINNICGDTTLSDEFKINQSNDKQLRVSIPLTRKVESDSVEILHATDAAPLSGTDKDGLFLYVYCSTINESENVRKRIIECKEILNTHCRWSGFMNIQILRSVNYVG